MKRTILTLGWLIFLSVVGWAGIQTPKGFLYKPDVGARGSAEKNLYDAGLDRVDARLGKEIWVGDPNYGTTLQDAITAISSNNVILRMPAGTHSISANLTLPANISLKPERGAILTVADGKTLTINGPFEAGLYPVFSCTGTGQVVFASGSIKELPMVWFGSDTTAITKALNAVPTGATLRFTAGSSYVFNPVATVTITGKSFNISCDPGVVIDATGSTASSYVLRLLGTVGTYYTLGQYSGADPAEGDRIITVNATLAASLTEGDLLKLTTDSSVGGAGTLWSSLNAAYWKGEICEVLSVSGANVTLKNALCDSYVAAGTVAAKITPITGELRNFRMQGPMANGQVAVDVEYCKDFKVSGGELKGFDYTCLQIYYGYKTVIDGYTASNFWKTGGTTNYGIMLASCQNASVVNCTISGGRHAVTTGGKEPCRFITIGPGNNLDSDPNSAMNCLALHENVERCKVIGNFVKNGITISGRSNEILDNTVTLGKAGNPPISVVALENDNYLKISGNRINVPDAIGTAGGIYGIRCYGYNNATIKRFDITNNEINGNCGGIKVYRSSNSGTFVINELNIAGNRGDLTNATNGYPIYLLGYDTSNRIQVDAVNIRANNFKYTFGIGVSSTHFNSTNLVLDDNTLFYNGAGTGSYPVYLVTNSTIDKILCRRNITNNAQAMNYFYMTAASYLEFTGNLLHNLNTYGGVRLTATDILCRDNRQVSCSGSLSLTGRYFEKIFGDGSVASWGTAAPTSGTWKQGDYCRNGSSAVGQPKGWVCTVTGTPGTWVSEGNL